MGLAALRPGLQRIALRAGQRQRMAGRADDAGLRLRHPAEPAGHGLVCRTTEIPAAKPPRPPDCRPDRLRLGGVAAGEGRAAVCPVLGNFEFVEI